jgi:hypothetical protein
MPASWKRRMEEKDGRDMKRLMISILIAVCLSLNCFSVVRASACEKGENEKASLPTNLILSRQTKPLVEKVWRRSPTFRLQCQRISQAQWLRVKLSFALPPHGDGEVSRVDGPE